MTSFGRAWQPGESSNVLVVVHALYSYIKDVKRGQLSASFGGMLLRIDDMPLTSSNIQTWLTQTENNVESTSFINRDTVANRTFSPFINLGYGTTL